MMTSAQLKGTFTSEDNPNPEKNEKRIKKGGKLVWTQRKASGGEKNSVGPESYFQKKEYEKNESTSETKHKERANKGW